MLFFYYRYSLFFTLFLLGSVDVLLLLAILGVVIEAGKSSSF